MNALLLSLLWIGQSAAVDPCKDIERGLDDATKTQLAPVIGRHLGVRGARIDEALRSGNWRAFLIGARDADQSVVLYAGDPLTTRQIEAIGVFALPENESKIGVWLRRTIRRCRRRSRAASRSSRQRRQKKQSK